MRVCPTAPCQPACSARHAHQRLMKILLADDSRVTRLLIGAALSGAGHEVVPVANGREAWERFSETPSPLVVLDWQMPEMDGLEVCRRIRASPRGDETFILVVTGRGTAEDVTVALAAGADDYVAKPITREVLLARLTIAERRMEQDAARRRAEAELARAQWLAGIGQTSIALQHEINNPLTALLAETQMMASDEFDEATLRIRVAAVAQQVRRIADVVRQLARLDDPSTIEYASGVRMLDLSARPRP